MFGFAAGEFEGRSLRKIEYLREWGVYAGTIDVKVYPTVKVYLPNRNGPMVTINTNDSIFWDYAAPSIAQAGAGLISETEMLKEASEFAGTVPVKYMLPHWKTSSRYLFTSGSVNMRDAAVYGGIIYVASYNPLTNKGQIGSFPSPERNISSNEISQDVYKRQIQVCLT